MFCNQSINHLFVLSSTQKQVNTQYSVEQDTKAWNIYRCDLVQENVTVNKSYKWETISFKIFWKEGINAVY